MRFFDLDAHDRRYDFVSALNLFSHLPDPVAALQQWKGLLNPGGELLLETGDTAGLPRTQHPRPYFLPDHLSFASESILVAMLRKAGFEIVAVQKFPWIEISPKAFVKECVKLFLPRKKSLLPALLRGTPLKTDMFVRARLPVAG